MSRLSSDQHATPPSDAVAPFDYDSGAHALQDQSARDDLYPEANASDREIAGGSTTVESETRRLLDQVQRLGGRVRDNQLRANQTDRRAGGYASRLARHTARLLAVMPDAVPVVRPVPGTGASSMRHYVLRHDQLESPTRIRLLVVSADGRLRICTVWNGGRGQRLWTDYEVGAPPEGMGLASVFEGLSSLIVQLEGSVDRAEWESTEREKSVDTMIAASEAVLVNSGSPLAPLAPTSPPPAPESEAPAPPRDDRLRSYGFERDDPAAGRKPTD
jgi:hypothetical protein